MDSQLIMTLCLLAACILAFLTNRVRMDFIALVAFAALPILGVIEFRDSLASFGDPNIIIIAMMFIISAGLMRTGITRAAGDFIIKHSGESQTKLVIFLMVAVAIAGSFMSTTGTVAIFLPIVLSICSRLKIPAAKMMMPLGFAGIISGMMTLVGTSPNLILNGELVRGGYKGFGLFDITPIGIIVLILGVLYMLFARRFLGVAGIAAKGHVKRAKLSDFIRDYDLSSRERIFKVGRKSEIVGKCISELTFRSDFGANIVCVERPGRIERKIIDPSNDFRILVDDILLVDMRSVEESSQMEEKYGISVMNLRSGYFSSRSDEIGMIEVVVSPESVLIGKTLIEAQFRSRYGLHAIGLRRNSEAVAGDIYTHKLRMGDILLLTGAWKKVRHLNADSRDFMVLNIPEEIDTAPSSPGRAPYAMLSLGVMLVLMAGGFVPNALAVFIACLLLVLFKCIDLDKAYASIYWPLLILIVGMMPFGIALQKTGGVEIAANLLTDTFGSFGPRGMLLGLCIATMFTGLFMSNTVTAILMAPLAMAAAETMGLSPYPFVMGVSIAAGTAFMTPLSTSVNMLILGPGRYSFWDFVRIGVPFSAIVTVVNVVVVPILYPF